MYDGKIRFSLRRIDTRNICASTKPVSTITAVAKFKQPSRNISYRCESKS